VVALAGVGFVEPVGATEEQPGVEQGRGIGAHYDPAGVGLDPNHPSGLAQRHAEAPALADGEPLVAGVHANDTTTLIDDLARSLDIWAVLLHEGPVVIIRDEADLLALRLVCGDQVEAIRQLANLGLVETAEGEQGVVDGTLGHGKQEIGLILPWIDRRGEAAAIRGVDDAAVVAGSEVAGPERQRAREQDLELEHPVALDARIGRAAREVGVREIVHHGLLEGLLEVHHIERDLQALRHAAGIESVLEATAVPRPPSRRVVQLHVHADDFVTLVGEERRGDGRVHAPTHGDDDLHGCVVFRGLSARSTDRDTHRSPGGALSLPVVAIVGRPNVGKSTLFNRLIGFKKAVVHDRPGVTRDRQYEKAELLSRKVLLIDTGGLEPVSNTDLLKSMRLQSLVAVEEADVIVFLVDGRAGMTPADDEVANLLRRAKKPVLLVVNKIDGPQQEDLSAEFWSVGFPDLQTVSAAHGRGTYELLEAIEAKLPDVGPEELDLDDETIEIDTPIEDHPAFEGEIRIAVLGRPNIGKSTLINHLLGEARHVVHDAPGTTMDPIDSTLETETRNYLLVDTAGVRRRSRIDDQVERWVSLRAIRAVERCHITLLMIDATVGPTDQDARLAQLITERGRALIVLVNKWDLTTDLEDVNSQAIEQDLERRLPHAIWAPHLFISAKTGKGVHRILPMVEKVFKAFDTRISTSRLNRFLEHAIAAHSPPQRHHRPVRIHFATQARVRPPTFIFFSNTPDGVAPPYRRYLSNRLREEFDLDGTPLRVVFRRKRKAGDEEEER